MSNFKVTISHLLPFSGKVSTGGEIGFRQVNLNLGMSGEMDRKKFYIFLKLNRFLYSPILDTERYNSYYGSMKDDTLDILCSRNKEGPKIKDEFEGFLNEVIDVIRGEGEYKSLFENMNLPTDEGNFLMDLFPQLLSYLKNQDLEDKIENLGGAYGKIFLDFKEVLKDEFKTKDSAFIFKELVYIKSIVHRKGLKTEFPTLKNFIGYLEAIKGLYEKINWEDFLEGKNDDLEAVNDILNLIIICNSMPRMRLIDTVFNSTINHLYLMIFETKAKNTSDLICNSLYSTIQGVLYDEDIDNLYRIAFFTTYTKDAKGKRFSENLKPTLYDELFPSYRNCKTLQLKEEMSRQNIYNRFFNILTMNRCEIIQRFNKDDIKKLRMLPYIFEFNLDRKTRMFNYLNRSIEILLKIVNYLPFTKENFTFYLNQIYYPNGLQDDINEHFSQNLKEIRKHEEVKQKVANFTEINLNDFTKPFIIDDVEHSLSPQAIFLPVVKKFMNNRNKSLYLLKKGNHFELSSKRDKEEVLYEFNDSNGNFTIYEINRFIKSLTVDRIIYRDVLREVDARSKRYMLEKLNNIEGEINYGILLDKLKESIVKDFISVEDIPVINQVDDLKGISDVQIVKYTNNILSFSKISNQEFSYNEDELNPSKFIKYMKSCCIEIYHVGSIEVGDESGEEVTQKLHLYKQLFGPSFLINALKSGTKVYSTTRQNFDNKLDLLCGNFYISKQSPEHLKNLYSLELSN